MHIPSTASVHSPQQWLHAHKVWVSLDLSALELQSSCQCDCVLCCISAASTLATILPSMDPDSGLAVANSAAAILPYVNQQLSSFIFNTSQQAAAAAPEASFPLYYGSTGVS
jgi:hypothetical protein